jgi:phosphatidylinositol kinase/protein kinase (PI-3  family)
VNKILNNQALSVADLHNYKFANKNQSTSIDLKLYESQEEEEEFKASHNSGHHERLVVNQNNLKKIWDVTQRSTRDDWVEWLRGFSIELLKESPSPALRACSQLAQKYPSLAKELFNAAFVSVWGELSDKTADDCVKCLEVAFNSPTIPPELLQILLNLAEFMVKLIRNSWGIDSLVPL